MSWTAGVHTGGPAAAVRPSTEWDAIRIVIEGHDLPGAQFVSDGVPLHNVHAMFRRAKLMIGDIESELLAARRGTTVYSSHRSQ